MKFKQSRLVSFGRYLTVYVVWDGSKLRMCFTGSLPLLPLS